jgi:hypothetical protein
MNPDYAKVVNALADAVRELNVETPTERGAAAAADAAAAEHSAHSAMSTSRHKPEKKAAAQNKPDQARNKQGPDKATQAGRTQNESDSATIRALGVFGDAVTPAGSALPAQSKAPVTSNKDPFNYSSAAASVALGEAAGPSH